jgi:hypothetical protein
MSASANAAGYLAMSAAVTAAVRNVSASRNRAGDSTLALYSPECVEYEFSETRMQHSAWIISPNRFCGAHPCFRVSKPVLHVMALNRYSLR